MVVIFNAIRIATRHECHLWRGRLCPKLRELWVEMIKGSDPTDHDVWLWMDGDEQWLRKKFPRYLVRRSFTGADHKGDWLDAHSALRRRIHRPRNNAGQLAERIRNATPEQRVAAICWLTCNSSRVRALAIELGHTPRGMFGPGEIVEDYREEVVAIRDLWKAFPENTAAWKEAAKKLEQNRCTCLKWAMQSVRCWFNMLTWLDGKPPTLEAIGGSHGCTRCQGWCVLRFTLSLYSDDDSEGRSYAMTSLDTSLRAQTTQRSRYGTPYVSVLFGMTVSILMRPNWPHIFPNWRVRAQDNRWNSGCVLHSRHLTKKISHISLVSMNTTQAYSDNM